MLGMCLVLSSIFWNLSIKTWFEGPITISPERLLSHNTCDSDDSFDCSLDV